MRVKYQQWAAAHGLHQVQDALIAKIKATGQSGFTVPEQAAIDSFASNAAKSKQEHPSSNVFG
jgi:hypothetical protein